MPAGFGILILITLFLCIGAGLGWVATSRTTRLARELRELAQQVDGIDRRLKQLAMPARQPGRSETEREPEAEAILPPTFPRSETESATEPASAEPLPAASAKTSREPRSASTRAPAEPGFFEQLFGHMRENWMAWLGGLSVSLAGIFLVGYSIEMGWIGPRSRIALAILTGLVLHAAAEYFRRRTRQAHPAFAALAGGASITLYGALFAALELYGLLSPGMTFALLAVVSLATMALATVHGPTLAIMGLLGAYVVPILITEHAGGTLVELIYSLIVTTASLYLIRFVYRPWLWFGTLAGALGWWLVSLTGADADGFRGLYVAALAWLALAIPYRDLLLDRALVPGAPATETVAVSPRFSPNVLQITIALLVLAEAISIAHLGFTGLGPALIAWSPLIVILFRAARARAALRFAPWALLVAMLGAWLVAALDETPDGVALVGLPAAMQREFLAFSFFMALLFSVGSALSHRGRAFSHVATSLSCLAPVLWLALSYLLVTDLSIAWQWSIATLALGLTYIFLSGRRLARSPNDGTSLWLMLGGHAAYSLAAAMYFREATLTLALAAQIISLAWLNRRYTLGALDWIIKGVLAIVVARLTLNPWLLTYPVDVHWSLWTYGGSVLCCLIGTTLTRETVGTRKWLEAATLHLLVLFLGAELRYLLYDGRIFVDDYTLTESAVNTVLWAGLGLSYFNRRRASQVLAHFYTLCSRVLLVLALGSYGVSLLFLNPLWTPETVGETPLLNLLLLAYGAPVLLALAVRLFYEPRFRDIAAAIAGGGFFVFVSLEIRHLWHRALNLDLGTTNGEMYTYSAAWLIMAVATMLTATRLGSAGGSRAGMALLLLVIAKIFIYDMAGLEGLLRVASFMGLGLALLGLAWLYQRTARPRRS